jgi:hypothetical protein
MSASDNALDDAIREIAALFAAAYLCLRFPENAQNQLDSTEKESPHVTEG